MLTIHELMEIAIIFSGVLVSNVLLTPLYRRLRINRNVLNIMSLVILVILES